MWGESSSHEDLGGRPLRDAERDLIIAMLGGEKTVELDKLRVNDAVDGDMGGIKFLKLRQSEHSFGRAIAEAQYVDADDILVSVVLNIDKSGDLLELDFWKVDFSPLQIYPKVTQIKLVNKS